MRRGWFLLLALSLGLNAGLLFTAISHHAAAPSGSTSEDPPRPLGLHRLEQMSRRLGLHADQREQMRAIVEEMMPKILEQRAAVRGARHELHETLRPPDPHSDFEAAMEPSSMRDLVRRISREQAILDSLVAEVMLREAQVLTPEQRQRYFEAMPWGPHPDFHGHRRRGSRGRQTTP